MIDFSKYKKCPDCGNELRAVLFTIYTFVDGKPKELTTETSIDNVKFLFCSGDDCSWRKYGED